MSIGPRSARQRSSLFAVLLCALVVIPLVASNTANASGSSSATSTSSSTTSVPTGGANSTTTSVASTVDSSLPWPAKDSAAVVVPSLFVAAHSPNQPRVAIASLTKLMTTWVVLQKLPLSGSAPGPCRSVTASDVAFYHQNLSIQESTLKIIQGVPLCEGTLLRGLLVHSAGDYAELLVRLTGMSDASFVATMNRDALLLGLTQTHYADYTGISPSDLSTAQDQATLGVDLMTSQPLAASIVALPKVKLPIAGWVGSYTPYVGTDGVVGVKSGYTLAAGGCVVMAINTNVGGIIVPTYEVILSQQSANALNVAGADALTLMRALRANMILTRSSSGSVVTWIGPAADVATTTTSTTTTTTTTTP